MTGFSRKPRLACLALAAAGACQLAASFEVRTIPAEGPGVHAFLAQVDADSDPELLVLSGNALTIVFAPDFDKTTTLLLEAGTSVFDIADTDGDGVAELYSIAGTEIRRRLLLTDGRASESTLLFSRDTWLAGADGYPKPYVLITTWEGRPALALADSEGLSLVGLDGTDLTRFSATRASARPKKLGAGHAVFPQAGPPGALEFNISATFVAPAGLNGQPEYADVAPKARRATPLQAREASRLAPEDWPWFLLAPIKGPDQRVAYALTRGARGDTLIRFRRTDTRNLPAGGRAFYFSPERRYPGTLIIPPLDGPDFNGDGYADLLMWSSPRPGASTDSLLRAIRSRNWPVRLTMHRYSRLREVYEGRPTARIELRLPLEWSLLPESGMPLRHLILSDMDGDGLTDVGLATGPTRYALWLSHLPGGFEREPDYTADLPERIKEIALVVGAATDRSSMIVLIGDRAGYLLTLPR